ncbi:hypothetical protein BDN72DRAFT_808930 [Pluteus cervinus]|uniref:Uncharacterized protein n=1 Tax=Pluteus cervinus TaxID=181527 RepID=A0ACD3BF19_9AGAR|nr:hypothetical protein BDN72DRAFT_808930 [Pluteus cervinus]
MDTHSFASLAHVRVLLVPVGSISRSAFETYAAEIRTFDSIRLGDIPADGKDNKGKVCFTSNPLSTGQLLIGFPSHPPPESHLPLSFLRPSHFPLAVIGIAACAHTDSLGTILAQFNASLPNFFPSGSIFPLAKNCFVFEESDGTTNLNLGNSLPGLVVIPSMMGNKKLYIGTLLADLCSLVLDAFGEVARVLETPLGNEYLNATCLPLFPPLSEFGSSDRRDSLPVLPSINSQPEISRAALGVSAPAMKRNSSSGPAFRQQTLSVAPPKKRLSSIGVASSQARYLKVLGDLYLLSGKMEDAVIRYTEALMMFKTSSDVVWHAAAVEGLATISIIEAWSAGHGLNNSSSGNSEPWAEIADKLAQATMLYSKSPAVEAGEHNYSLLSYLYCCSVLRHVSLLFSIWSAKGWGPLAFTTMLHSGPTAHIPPTLISEDMSGAVLERLSTISRIPRASISAVLSQVHGPWLLHLGVAERIAVLEATASLFSCLGYKRKEAYVLREVLGCVLDLVVCGRDEEGSARASPDPGAAKGAVAVRRIESVNGNDSVLRLLKHICSVLGINLEAVSIHDGNASELAQRSNDEPSKADHFGWPELQVGVIREAVAVAEALPDFIAVSQFSLSALKTLQAVLSAGDQYHLHTTASRALTTARRRGENKLVDYWSSVPILSLAITPLPLIRLPIETPISALQPKVSDITPILTGATDPFLYNPRRALAIQGKTLVVQNEALEFVVTLQNPYIFDMELQDLTLSTTGVPLDVKPIRVLLQANSFHTVTLIGKAPETGNLVIRGCTAHAPGSITCEFLLPLSSDEEEEEIARRRSAAACESDRFKFSGLECLPWTKKSQRLSLKAKSPSRKPPRYLECKIVAEQPLLRVRRSSVTHGALMLYDGEISVIRITLENVSSLPVDFLRLAFDDSTIAPGQQALSEGDLSVFETYETEYNLIHRPVFSWNKDDAKDIAPGQKLTLTITCFGKVGCTSGMIHVSYSYARRPQTTLAAPPDVFHIRQLSYPLTVTVYQMLECHSMDILSFPTNLHRLSNMHEPLDLRNDNLLVDQDSSWCMFSVEVRNMYGSPFEVTFERCQEGTPSATTSAIIPPGSMSRILLPLKKFRLSDEALATPIPTLSDRQFVVAKAKLTQGEVQAQRSLFWYREELFKLIRGTWKEAGGSRSGDLSLRSQRMTMTMLETLRMETTHVSLSFTRDPNSTSPSQEGDLCIRPNEFVYIFVEVSNVSVASAVFTLDLAIEPADHIVYEGVLSGLPIGRLEPGSSWSSTIAMCFLARGRFEVFAEVKSLTGLRSGFQQLITFVRENT